MGKLLQLLILATVAWLAFRLLQGKPLLPPRPRAPDEPRPGHDVMRRCALCQVHVPDGESTRSRGHFFCCEAHRDAFFREQR